MKLRIKENVHSTYEDYDYKGESFYGLNFRGLSDSIETDDYDELCDFAWNSLMKGECVRLYNTDRCDWVRLSPEACDLEVAESIDDFIIWDSKTGNKKSLSVSSIIGYGVNESIRESDSSQNNADIIKRLEYFGFENSGEGEPYYDYFMTWGFHATWNIERNEGYFTWNPPSGNAVDVGKTYTSLDEFLGDVCDYDAYNCDDLIEDGLEKKGFENNEGSEYIITYKSHGCKTTACFDTHHFRGWVSREYDDPDYESEYLDDLYFDELIEECSSDGIL